MSDPYRTPPPAEWPKSLRAAFKAGQYSCQCTSHMGLRLFLFCILFSMAAGGAIGAGLMRDQTKTPEPPPTCSVRPWDSPYHPFALARVDGRVFPDMIGRFRSLEEALDAARKVGCTIEP